MQALLVSHSLPLVVLASTKLTTLAIVASRFKLMGDKSCEVTLTNMSDLATSMAESGLRV